MRTLLSGAVVVTCDQQHTVLDPGDLLIEDDRIAWVGDRYQGEYDHRIAAAGRLLMPGLVNAHTHSPMSIFRGLADDVDLQVFLAERVWPREIRLTGEDVYAGSLLSGVEMLRSGVTSYVDMYFFEEDLLRAALDLGMRALITPAIIDTPEWEPIVGSWERRTQGVLDFCRRWHGYDGRISTGLGPHAPYTLSLDAMRDISQEARREGRLVNTHLLETRVERDAFRQQGAGEIQALDGVDFFQSEIIAAHSVWVDDCDLDVYRRRGVGVAHCPQSNAKLGAGIAPVARMRQKGIDVGLGTDGAATNNNLDLWEELRSAPLLAKVSALDPRPLPAAEALWMATREGARVARLTGVGELRAGFKADVVMLRLDDTSMVPSFEPRSYIGLLVYSAGRHLVDSVWVNGRRVVLGGEVCTVDEEAARRRAQEAALAVARRVEA